MTQWLRELWAYYLAYTKRPLHTAAAAAFAIFGLLVFVDPLFAVLAITVYVVPPVVLYVIEDESLPRGARPDEGRGSTGRAGEPATARDRDSAREGNSRRVSSARIDDGDTDSDTDSDDGDTDTDRVGTDTDSDRSG